MTIMLSLLLRASLLASLAWAMPVPDKASQSDSCPDVPYYTLEEHWLSPSLSQMFLANPQNQLFGANMVAPKLQEIGLNRIADMNANKIKIQIISHVPVPEVLSEPAACRTANDELASAVAAFPVPARFHGFCILPMALLEDAAEELRRCVTANKFVGALADAHLGNQSFYDGPAHDLPWAAAASLGVPIYLHPTYPNLEDATAIGTGLYAPAVEGGYTPAQAETLALTTCGWHERTGMGFLRLYLAGVFDRQLELQSTPGDKWGGIYPFHIGEVHAGDRLDDRYRIIYKFGHGCYSTMWLAFDEKRSKYFRFHQMTPGQVDRLKKPELVSVLHDRFHHGGPNGVHECLVATPTRRSLQEVKGAFEGDFLQLDVARSLGAQLVMAVAEVHSKGYAHGDEYLCLNNIFLRFPSSLDILSTKQLYDRYSKPRKVPVRYGDRGARPTDPGIPPYVVKPVKMKMDEDSEDVTLRDARLILGGFRSAFRPADKSQLESPSPFHIRHPEAYFEPGKPLTSALDIWSLVCVLFEFYADSALISGTMYTM
ncbi:hypothetical protein CSOJ01_14958 [Colletotrichum sojae]|uniref:Protein kinase domain-containing protein n=1 Tax=Colletotrichum sojae TaxID=2175907 RepID=A0A8H6INN8_9PEZI|nr:hypothetical protein CSOJ01_14958 [Colletotrichum sojae]